MYTGNFVKYNNLSYMILKIINKYKIIIINHLGETIMVDRSAVQIADCNIEESRRLLGAKYKEKNKKSEIFVKNK